MSIKIKYAYLQHHTWMYRRHLPRDEQIITGLRVFKQTLKTSDAKEAVTRASAVNTKFDQIVSKARAGVVDLAEIEPATVLECLPQTATPEEIWLRGIKSHRCCSAGTSSGGDSEA